MTTRPALLTPERLQNAFSYEGFLKIARPDLRARFQAHEIEVHLTEDEIQPFRAATGRAGGPAQVVLLGEDWCPDVQRALPLLRFLSEAVGWELRVLRRDENLDIMAQFPARSDVPRIPTVLFLSQDGQLLGSWIERPAVAQEEIARHMEHTPEEERNMAIFQWQHRFEWRQATLEEWKRLLGAG